MPLNFVTPIPKPKTPPPRYDEFQQWVRANLAELEQMGDDEAIARFALFDIDCALFIRYGEECDRRSKEGLPPDHYAPGYGSPLRYKRCYVRSPAEFEALVNHQREMRKRTPEQRQEDRRCKERERDLAQQAKEDEQEEQKRRREQEKIDKRKRTIRNIKRWHKQGMSVQQISLKIGGRRKDTLLLIRETIQGIRKPKQEE